MIYGNKFSTCGKEQKEREQFTCGRMGLQFG